jgi:membrane associated rhomboid family serine protease
MARPRLEDRFTFGGRLPWGLGLVLVLTVACSIFVAVGSRHAGDLSDFASLYPKAVWRLELWRLVTWPFIEPGPIALIFTCLLLYWFGRDLAEDWGSRRFLAVFGGVTLAAGVGTSLVAAIDVALVDQRYVGGWAVTAAMIVAWGLWFPERVVRLYFVLPIRGYWLAWLTIGITLILAAYSGWERYLPEMFAEGSTLAWLFRRSIRARWSKTRRAFAAKAHDTRLRDRAKKRAKSADYLRLIEADDDDPPPLPPEVEGKIKDLMGGRGKRTDDDD